MDITEQLTHESRIALAAAAEITRLRAEVEALRADAERYRWLRKQDWVDSPMVVLKNPRGAWILVSDYLHGVRLDKLLDEHIAIDAARAAQGDKT